MKSKKLSLKNLQVKSFVTKMDQDKINTVKGIVGGGPGDWGNSDCCSVTCTNGVMDACCSVAV